MGAKLIVRLQAAIPKKRIVLRRDSCGKHHRLHHHKKINVGHSFRRENKTTKIEERRFLLLTILKVPQESEKKRGGEKKQKGEKRDVVGSILYNTVSFFHSKKLEKKEGGE